LKEAGKPEAKFIFNNFFTIIFERNITAVDSVNGSPISTLKTTPKSSLITIPKGSLKSSVKIIELIVANCNITIAELALKLSITERAVKKNLTNLKRKGKIQRVGSDRSGYWEVTEH
jgi:ATP-dependent DNA helicase RecG